MADEVRISWEVEDGYAGKRRPQTTYVSIEEMVEDCGTEEEVAKWLDNHVMTEFENRISWGFLSGREEAVEAWRKAREVADAQED